MVEKKHPSDAELRLWLARVKNEMDAGTPPEETAKVFEQIVKSWNAIKDNEPPADDDGHDQPKARTVI